MLHISI